jgi:vitamin B12 transporter
MKTLTGATCATIILSSTLAAPSVRAEEIEKIVVTGNRIGQTTEERLGTSVTIVNASQIEQRQTVYVSDILRDVPGLAISRTGGPGGATQVRTRGSEGNHTLVLFDGAEVNDPFQGEFDFSGLLASDIARIEILRGSQSALYGSDAIGGVINFIPKRGTGPLAFGAEGELGSFNTAAGSLSGAWGDDRVDLYASTSYRVTDGTNIARSGDEDDGSNERSWFLNSGVRLSPEIELRAFLRKVLTRAEGDPQDFTFLSPTQGLAIDGDDITRTDSLYGNVQLEANVLDGMLETKLAWNFTDGARFNYSGGAPSFFSEGYRDKLSAVAALNLTTADITHRITGAIDWKKETYRNVAIGVPTPLNDRRELENTGFVGSYDVAWGNLDAGLAFRHDRNERFEDADTWRAQVSYRIGDTRLRATSGSGIKNPNNFELFGFDPTSFIGNPSLKPEKSVGWDVGIDHYLLDRNVKLSATWFEATLEDEIWTDFIPPLFVATPKNRATDSSRKGLELSADTRLDAWTLAASYTWTNAEENGLAEIRRPEHIASLNAAYDFGNASLGLGLRYNGEQQDSEFIFATPEDTVALDPYVLVNLYGTYRLTDKLELFARVENLLDEQYEDVFSFRAPGVSAYAGVRFTM